ncbi:MAG: dipeptide epimerase [Armatimonadetes bacterium]|nr:MAG: dipeptide epimerase [Armatimonadota bacterium]
MVVQIRSSIRYLRKRRPLTISRGTSSATENLFVEVHHGQTVGWGEAAPIGYGRPQSAQICQEALERFNASLFGLEPWNVYEIEQLATEQDLPSAARAALNMACWDWIGKRVGQPLWRLLGLSGRTDITSVTVGINPLDQIPELIQEWVAFWRDRAPFRLKLKLGYPGGIEEDQAAFECASKHLPAGGTIRVDANGAWNPSDACTMLAWLAKKGCEYVEQPISHEDPEALECLRDRPLPVFLDESVHTSLDVPRVADYCDGVNVKLMKAGGISEGIRIAHTARAFRLKVMIGCFSESSLAIAAAAQLSDLVDYFDLDSHFNLVEDPFLGLECPSGCLVCSAAPGLGVQPR